jgi:hypothetical protein
MMSPTHQQEQILVPRAPTKEELGQAIKQRPVDFNSLNYFKKGWAAFKANVCAFWGTLFIYFFISMVSLFLSWKMYCKKFGEPDFSNVDWHHGHHGDHEMDEDDEKRIAQQLPKSFVIWFIATFAVMYFFVWAPMKSSFFRASFQALRTNSKMTLADAFSSFSCPYWCRLLWLTICFTALSACFGPISGALVGFFGMFSYGLHCDNDHIPLGVWSSLKFSTQAVIRHFCGILAFVVLSMILNFIGLLAFGFGLLITVPVTWFAYIFVYHDVVRINGFPVVAPVGLSQVTVQQGVVVAPVVSVTPSGGYTAQPVVSPSSGYTQLQDFQDVEGAC